MIGKNKEQAALVGILDARNLMIVIASAVLMLLGVLLLNPSKVNALAENTTGIPSSVTNSFYASPWCGEGHAQYPWISIAGNSTQTSVSITQGTDTVGLWANSATAHCNENVNGGGGLANTDLKATRVGSYGATTNVGSVSVVGDQTVLNYSCSNNNNLRWVKICRTPPSPFDDVFPEHQDMTLSGLSSLSPGWHTVNVTITQKFVHWYMIGGTTPRFNCVSNPGYQETNSIDDTSNSCWTTNTGLSFLLYVASTDNPPQLTDFRTSCDNTVIAISDADYGPGPNWTLEIDYNTPNERRITNGRGNATVDIRAYKDAFAHNLTLVYYSANSSGGNAGGGVRSTARAISPACAPPQCAMSASPTAPEPSEPYTATMTVSEPNKGAQGLPLGAVTMSANLPAPTGRQNTGATINTTPHTQTWNGVAPASAGSYNFNGSYVDYAGGRANCSSGIVSAANRPYFKVYGGSATVGSEFGTSCSVAGKTSRIRAHAGEVTIGSGQWRGASSELAAFAAGTIEGFFTAGNRAGGAPANQPVGLSFGNYAGGFVTMGAAGKDTSGAVRCMPDYYQEVSGGTLLSDGTAFDMNTGGNPLPSAVNKSNSGFYYYQGDLVISSNITFDGSSGGWGNAGQVPYLYVVVSGNIYIAPGVTQLDGVYIAQPNAAGTGGMINTCNGQVSACGQKLTINGSFIAREVLLNRTRGTIRSGSFQEPSSSGNIAEVFNFTPEMYLGGPDELSTLQRLFTEYDSIVGLPPVL